MADKKTIEELGDEIYVLDPGMWENEHSKSTIGGWYAVANDKRGGIIAYFQFREDACRFRIDRINMAMEGTL